MNENGNTAGEKMNCEDIRSVLFDYMSRELGQARADLVREHLRRCPDCQVEAARIRNMLDLLQEASRAGAAAPARLSDERRARIVRAFMHPVLDWIYVHHILVSALLTVAALLLLGAVLLTVRTRRAAPEPGYPVVAATNANGAVYYRLLTNEMPAGPTRSAPPGP